MSCAEWALQRDLMWKADSLHRMPQLSSAGVGLKDEIKLKWGQLTGFEHILECDLLMVIKQDDQRKQKACHLLQCTVECLRIKLKTQTWVKATCGMGILKQPCSHLLTHQLEPQEWQAPAAMKEFTHNNTTAGAFTQSGNNRDNFLQSICPN